MFLDAGWFNKEVRVVPAIFLKSPLINQTFADRGKCATKTSRQGKYFFVDPGIPETLTKT